MPKGEIWELYLVLSIVATASMSFKIGVDLYYPIGDWPII